MKVLAVLTGLAGVFTVFAALIHVLIRGRFRLFQGKLLVVGIGLFTTFGIYADRHPDQFPKQGHSLQKASTQSEAIHESEALEMMEVAFDGHPSRARIKTRLDLALTQSGHPLTEENYSRAGSVLVALRKRNTGLTEMAILDYMIRSHVPGPTMSFAERAGLSAAFMAVGDR